MLVMLEPLGIDSRNSIVLESLKSGDATLPLVKVSEYLEPKCLDLSDHLVRCALLHQQLCLRSMASSVLSLCFI